MSGESIPVYGSTVNAVINGEQLLDTVYSTLIANAHVGQHGMADLVFDGTFAAAADAGSVINVFRRDLDIKGGVDAPMPDAVYPHTHIASIPLDAVVSQTVNLPAVPISSNCEFYIENASGQTLNAGWTLDVKPFGWGTAP